jgi:hypothetical protein
MNTVRQRMGTNDARRYLAAFALALLVGLLLVVPFFRAHGNVVSRTHDMDQHLAVVEDFDQALHVGNFYPRWQAGFNGGYGLPWLNYYQPGFYYLAEPAYVALQDSTEALLVVSVLAMTCSGLSFFWFARLFYSPIPAAAGALLYMTAPYHIVDLYIRGAFPEFSAFLFAPLVFGAAFLTCRDGRPRHYAALAFAASAFLLVHLTTAYLALLALGLYVMIWTIVDRNWRILARWAAACTLALLVSAIYWLPAAAEAGFMDEYYTKAYPYSAAYLPFSPPKNSLNGFLNKSFFLEAAVILAAIVLLIAIALPWRNPPEKQGDRQDALTRLHTRMLLAAGMVSMFLITRLSAFASAWIPKLQIVSFPWRGLLPVSFFAAVAGTAVLHRLDQRSDSPAQRGRVQGWRWSYRGAIAALILCHVWAAGAIVSWALRQPNLMSIALYTDNFLYPHGATPPSKLPDTPNAMLVAGQGRANVTRWEPFWREVDVATEQAAVVRLRTYNFPGWIGRVDGHPVAIESDKGGVQTIAVPAGNHRIEVRLNNTRVQSAGAAISGLGVLMILGLLAADYWDGGKKRWARKGT